MISTELSFGAALADSRCDYARMLDDGGEPGPAAELMEQALELAPQWPAGWSQLAEFRQKAGNGDGAVDALHRLLALDPQDMFGARLRLALLGAIAVPEQPPSRYVEALFDDYAGRFDTALVGQLDYRVPQELAALLRRTGGSGAEFSCAVDLGCGTGLFGLQIRSHATRLEGFDLSHNMLAKARDKAVYDRLTHADLSLPGDLCGLFSPDLPAARADLVSAADVMIYLGNLENVFSLAATLAAPGGLFAFSVEEGFAAEGFSLAPSLRYVHSQAYVEALLDRTGFRVLEHQRTTIRKDGGKAVAGILFVAGRRAERV